MTMKFWKLSLSMSALVLSASVNASVVTFDTMLDLINNFNLDVISGDSGTQWNFGYSATSRYEGSDGGFVSFNDYSNANSLQFLGGPVYLNGFDISSQWAYGGGGVIDADTNGRDYTLELYDPFMNLIYSNVHYVSANGNWDFLSLNVDNVSIIRILPTWSADGVYDGWWPNIDNITYNVSSVPLPAAAWLFGSGLVVLTGFARRKRV